MQASRQRVRAPAGAGIGTAGMLPCRMQPAAPGTGNPVGLTQAARERGVAFAVSPPCRAQNRANNLPAERTNHPDQARKYESNSVQPNNQTPTRAKQGHLQKFLHAIAAAGPSGSQRRSPQSPVTNSQTAAGIGTVGAKVIVKFALLVLDRSGERLAVPQPAQRRRSDSYSCTPRIPTTIPLISEMRPRHHTPAFAGTGLPSVL